MTHPAPTKVTIEPIDEHVAEITFFGPTYQPATARYPREEVARWVEKWLKGPAICSDRSRGPLGLD